MKDIVGVFVFYDEYGIVDDYVIYLLDKINQYIDDLIIVSNGFLKEEYSNTLSAKGSYYIERKNEGYDFGAWKEVLLYRFPIEFWMNYKKALFFNDTFYGPICSMQKIFSHFENASGDLWGLTRFGETIHNEEMNLPFLQTYFWGIKETLLHNCEFFQWWEKVDETVKEFSTVQNYEIELSDYFQSKGYKLETFIDTSDFEMNKQLVAQKKRLNRAVDKYELMFLINHGFPFVKRKNFFYPRNLINELKLSEDLGEVLEYVSEKTEYDVEYIFKNILRIKEPKEVSEALNQNYVICERKPDKIRDKEKCLIVAVVTKENRNVFYEYISKFNNVYVMVFTDDNYAVEVNAIVYNSSDGIERFEREIVDFLNIHHEIKYVCILGEPQKSIMPRYTYNSYQKMLYELLIKSESYVDSIIEIFESNSFISMANPIIAVNKNNSYLKGNERLGAWFRKDLFYNYMVETKRQIFRKSIYMYIGEMLYEISEYCARKNHLSVNIISEKYASILITNYMAD